MAGLTEWGTGDDLPRAAMDEVEHTLLEFVGREAEADGERVTIDERLVDAGRIDAIGLLQILAFLEERWRVDLQAAGAPRELQSVAGLAAAVRRELAARARIATERT